MKQMQFIVVFLIFFTISNAALLKSTRSTVSSTSSSSTTNAPFLSHALNPADVTATTFSQENPIDDSLFGSLAPQKASQDDLKPYAHPRVLMGASEWDELLTRYADDKYFNTDGSWSKYHRRYTLSKGPLSDFITDTSSVMDDNLDALYTGATSDLTSISEDERDLLLPLVQKAELINELKSGSLVMCAFWASVNRKRMEMGKEAFLREDMVEVCVKATVGWATVMLAHRAHTCYNGCEVGDIWDFNKLWEVRIEWKTASMSMALAYDFLYGDMTETERRRVRSALSLLVMKRYSWGNSEFSNRISPNAALHPHRIFSNWALYHTNLYLANLAIEGEDDVEKYAQVVLDKEGVTAFNAGLQFRFEAMILAYLQHSFYPDGSTYEDGYSYFIAFREGALALVAANRRGLATLDTPRFKNLIHNAAQMYEPWHCGSLIGHSSGGGNSYPTHLALFRYAYPEGALPTMLWRQRMGVDFKNNNPCRIEWHQNMIQLTFLGGEHSIVTEAESLQGLSEVHKGLIPKSYYATRRGLLIARHDHSENSALLHFDARGDAFFPGHDNADRGVFTFSALRRTWIGELFWRDNIDSRRHSLMHIDGLAQDEKAPCVRMLKVQDSGDVVIAAADLTYAYNVHWARGWPHDTPPRVHSTVYQPDGTSKRVYVTFTEREYGDPRDFGWPAGDDGADLGLARPESNLFGDEDVGFRGMWTWKKKYREVDLAWGVRSASLVRDGRSGYALIVDSFGMTGDGRHDFESYFILEPGVRVDENISVCNKNVCKIVLKDDAGKRVDVHVRTLGDQVEYRTETFDGHHRFIVKSSNMQMEEFWVALVPYDIGGDGFGMARSADGVVTATYGNMERYFEVNVDTHMLEERKKFVEQSLNVIDLDFKKKLVLTRDMMSDAEEKFLHPEGGLQAVVRIVAQTPRRKSRGDRIQTCFDPETNVPTALAIYDCGNAEVEKENFEKRACTLVYESGNGDVCRGLRTKLSMRLQRGKAYYVAVSVQEDIAGAQVAIVHQRGKV